MYKLSADEIVANIGTNLCSDHDYTPLGKDEKKDLEALKGSLKYFIANWLVKELKKLEENAPANIEKEFVWSDYLAVFNELRTLNSSLFTISQLEQRVHTLKIDICPTIDIFLKYNILDEYSTTIIMEYVDPERILKYGGYFSLTPQQILDFFSNIDSRIAQEMAKIIASGLKYCLPYELQKYYKRAKLTKDMGHSVWNDNDYLYGHEFRLEGTISHDVVLAYITDYFWSPELYRHTMENAKKAYKHLICIADILPANVGFECVHPDDCGVDLTDERELPKNHSAICRAMETIKRHKDDNESLSTEDYEKILQYNNLDKIMTSSDLQQEYENGIITRIEFVKTIENKLAKYKDSFFMTMKWDKVLLYLLPKRTWFDRECCLKIPYSVDISFLSEFEKFRELASTMKYVFHNDIETSVGLLPCHSK